MVHLHLTYKYHVGDVDITSLNLTIAFPPDTQRYRFRHPREKLLGIKYIEY